MSEIDAATDSAADTDTGQTGDIAEQTEAAPDAAGDEQQPVNENREAAKYRVRAREAETERDQLCAIVADMQKAEISRLAGQRLAKGDDIWSDENVTLESMLGEDGRVSAELVNEALAGVIERHGNWRIMGAPPASAVTGNDKIGGQQQPSFSDAFRPRNMR